MSLNWEVDFICEERRRRLRSHQPLVWDWLAVARVVSGVMIVAALYLVLR